MSIGLWPQCNSVWKMLYDEGDWPSEEGGELRKHRSLSHVSVRFYFTEAYLVFSELFQNFYSYSFSFYSFSLNSLTFSEENKLPYCLLICFHQTIFSLSTVVNDRANQEMSVEAESTWDTRDSAGSFPPTTGKSRYFCLNPNTGLWYSEGNWLV